MTLPSSGAISINDLKAETGAAANNLLAYLAGGGIVAPAATGDGGPIPSSSPLSLQDFYGYSHSTPSTNIWGAVGDFSIVDNAAGTGGINPESRLTVSTNGVVLSRSVRTGFSDRDDNYDSGAPSGGLGSDYSARATLVSGSAPTLGTLNTWLVVTVDRAWSYNAGASSPSSISGDLLIEIRHDPSGDVQSNTITFGADRF